MRTISVLCHNRASVLLPCRVRAFTFVTVFPWRVTNENVVQGEAFRKIQKKAKKLGAKSLQYSKRKDKKYLVTLESGKKIHFGSTKHEDYLSHKDDDRRKKYLKRAKGIKNKQGELTFEKPESANYWSIKLLW